jgi:hypothetical protein
MALLGVLGFGAAGGMLGWMVALFTAPMDEGAITAMAADMGVGTAIGLGVGIVVLS